MINKDKILPSFDKNRQVLGEILPLSTPFTVIVDISEACQFSCCYCFRSEKNKKSWGYAKSNKLMEWELFCKAIDQISEFPEEVKQISLSNHGEPLCNRKLPDMVRYIKGKGIKSKVSIHTNGALLDEKYARDLMQSGIDKVVISLQGLTEKKYKKICGIEMNYKEFYSNLSTLYSHKVNSQIYIKIADVALDKGEEETFYSQFSPIADRVFIEQIVPIWKEVSLENIQVKEANKYGEVFEKQKSCPLIFHTIVIAPEGDVYPCTQLLTPFVLGNIEKQHLQEIWNSNIRKDLLIRQCENNNPSICENCYIKQNSIYTKEDMIDNYCEDILQRIKRGI